MTRCAEIVDGEVVQVILATPEFIAESPGVWIQDVPNEVSPGWTYDGTDFYDPTGVIPVPIERGPPMTTILHPVQWVDRFNDAERAWLKAQRNSDTNAGRRLNDLWAAVIATNSIDVASPYLDPFYDWLLANGIPGGQTRIDELRISEEIKIPGAAIQ